MTKAYRVYQVDSFTTERFRGNPAGVVPNADGLEDAQMQAIAREMNDSETAFVLSESEGPREQRDYDVHVRFFTPTCEVPICGHATVAAHYVLATERHAPMHSRIVQRTGAGILPVDVDLVGGRYRVTMTQGRPEVGDGLPAEIRSRIAKAIGLDTADLRDDCPMAVSSTGHSKVMVGIRSRAKLDSLKPNLMALADISEDIGCNGYYPFTLDPGEDPMVHGRMFAPAIGIVEDPVTGNANGPLGAYLAHYGIIPGIPCDGTFSFRIAQGEAIGRAGTMEVLVDMRGGVPRTVQIAGDATIAFATTMEL